MAWEQQVFSEMAQSVGYDDERQEMIVTFKNGRKAAYSGVPEEMAVSIANAPSVGQAINSQIKGVYNFRYV